MSNQVEKKKTEPPTKTRERIEVIDQRIQNFNVKVDQGQVSHDKRLRDMLNTGACLHMNLIAERQAVSQPYRKEVRDKYREELKKTEASMRKLDEDLRKWAEKHGFEYP